MSGRAMQDDRANLFNMWTRISKYLRVCAVGRMCLIFISVYIYAVLLSHFF